MANQNFRVKNGLEVGTGVTISGGIVTATTFSGNATSSTYASTAGITTYSSISGISTSVIGGIGNISQLQVSGVSTFQSSVFLGDGDVLYFGDGEDLLIWHNSTDSIIRDNGTGDLLIEGGNRIKLTNPTGTETYGVFNQDGAVELYYDNVKKFETTGAGAIIVGVLTATKFIGDGSLLTNINTSQWVTTTTGIHTLSNVGIGTTNPEYKLHVVGNTKVEGNLYSTQSVIGGSSLDNTSDRLRVDASYIAGGDSKSSVFLGLAPFTSNRGGMEYVYSDPSGVERLNFFTNGNSNTRMTIDFDGNVGIGSTNPTSKLSVTGNVNVSGVVTATTFVGSLSGSLSGGVLTNYAETLYSFGNTGATPTFSLSNGNFITATLDVNITSMTFSMSGVPSGAFSFTLFLRNDATPGRTITWPPSVRWSNGSVPVRTTTANQADVYTFFTTDGGSVWYGNLSLYNYA